MRPTIRFLGQGFIWSEADVDELADGIRANVRGEKFDPSRHRFLTELKAVTYHQLEVVKDERGKWRARMIFDV